MRFLHKHIASSPQGTNNTVVHRINRSYMGLVTAFRVTAHQKTMVQFNEGLLHVSRVITDI